MLNMPPSTFAAVASVKSDAASIGLRDLAFTLVRGWRFLAISLFCCLGVAITIVGISRPSYVAVGKVLIEARGPSLLTDGPSGFSVDTGFVDSQVEVLGSASIATSVIQNLRLQDDPFFSEARNGDQPLRQTLMNYNRSVSVRRIGQSNVIEVSAQARLPELAAKIANEVVEVYLSGRWKYDRSPENSRFTGDVQRAVAALSYAQVITRAEIPIGKSSPKASLILAFALVAGLIIGGVVAIATNKGQPGLRSCNDISRLTGFRALQTCPQILPAEIPEPGADLPDHEGSASIYHKSLVALKTSLDTNLLDSGARSIGVLSLSVGGGASTMVEKLAMLYAAAGTRVLVIDANFRSAFLSKRLAPRATTGLLQVLTAPGYLPSLIRVQERLALLPLVGTNSSIHVIQLLRSQRVMTFLARAKANFDVILIDMPAYASMTDAGSVKDLFDHMIVLCEWDKIGAADLSHAMRDLEISGKSLDATIILNKVPRPRAPSSRPNWQALKPIWQSLRLRWQSSRPNWESSRSNLRTLKRMLSAAASFQRG